MFGKLAGLGKLVGLGGSPSSTPPVFPPADPQAPVPLTPLTPFPLTGEKVTHKGYVYTLPSDLDFLAFRQIVDDPNGWVPRYAANGMYSWDRVVPNESMRLVKAFGVFEDCPSDRLYDMLQDPEYRIEWDNNRLEGYCLAHLADRTDIGYYAGRVPKPVANRDFVNMRSWREVGNGEFVIMSTSVAHVDMPEKEGFVRAYVKVSGYLVRRFGDDGTSCSVTYVSHSDPKGWVPSYFVNTLTTKLAPNVITTMRNAAAKYPLFIEKKGALYTREWKGPEAPWPVPVQDLLHVWVLERMAKGAAASPVVVESEPIPEDEAEQLQAAA